MHRLLLLHDIIGSRIGLKDRNGLKVAHVLCWRGASASDCRTGPNKESQILRDALFWCYSQQHASATTSPTAATPTTGTARPAPPVALVVAAAAEAPGRETSDSLLG